MERKRELLRQARNLENIADWRDKWTNTKLSSLDPEFIQNCIMLAAFHIETGTRSCATYSIAMIEDLGESVRPYLCSFYEAVRHYPGRDTGGMSTSAEVDALEAAPAPTEKGEHNREIEEDSMSHKMLDRLASKLATLLSELTPQEANEAWSQILYEWELSDLISVMPATMNQPNPLALIDAAGAQLLARLRFNRHNEFVRAMTATTPQQFSDAIR
ncbi:hypothetical protein ARD30_20990 [Bosea thiooxidans]|uniref:Uncharacterized protein n=1 Tax=Bosea thiooxidans TaxID=53254 RepID=A0A0Q3I0Z8_9HYPH|nr:hypothetical protein ARD30_20990 [Bosea thiooxidans]